MAGAGYKLFNTGDVLTAAQVNTYLMQQTVMVFASAAARTTALSGVLAEGMVSYLQDTDVTEVYNGSAWVGLAADQTPLTTKGDLFTYSTADARLGVGTNGQILTADSTTATGLKWATPSSGAFTLLSTTTLSGSGTTVSNISQSYTHLYVSLDRVDMDTATYQVVIQPNSSGSMNELYINNVTWGNSTGAMTIFNGGTDTNAQNAAGVWIMNYSSTSMWKPMIAFGANKNNSSASRGFLGAAVLEETTAVSSMYVRPLTNSFNGGTMRIYGVN